MIRQIVWDTKSVNEAAEKMSNGFILSKFDCPFFEKTIGLRSSGLVFKMSPEEFAEYAKCAMDIHYFSETYCYVKGDDGQPIIIPLRDYQREILDNFYNQRFNILMSARQSGKTICSSITMLHYVLFNNNKNVLVTANKLDTSTEVLDKIKEIYQRLPFFLQQGIVNWAQKLIAFENKTRIKAFATTKTSSIGQSADFLYLDEFAHLPDNIAEKFYKSVFPTVSNIDNSKIIITSTPNGLNLFHKLLTDAEKPEGEKSSYFAKRVYWWQIPKRFVTYIRLDSKKIDDFKISKEEILDYLIKKYPNNKFEIRYNDDLRKWVIFVFNSPECSEENILSEEIKGIRFLEFSMITTWKKETIKDIGGEEMFNQEYDLKFINSSKSVLTEQLMEELTKNKKSYEWEQIYEMDLKLKFPYQDLKWVKDDEIYLPLQRKKMKIVMSVDISEGLGQDYSVINIFKISPKPLDVIESQKKSLKNETDFFKLEQIGIFRNNLISVGQLSEILYILAFEYFNPDNVKISLEINTYGNELLAHLPNVFDGNNEYGSRVFLRYKHRSDATEEKIGIKIGDNKNLLVKNYQEKMENRSISITNDTNISEIATFTKHTTSAGNTRYEADGSAKDDTVMTVVTACTVFEKPQFKQLIEEYLEENPQFMKSIEGIMSGMDLTQNSLNYSQVLSARRNNIYNNKMRKDSSQSISDWMSRFKNN